MPRPRTNENKSAYIKRAIPIFIEEGYSQEQAVGRAYGFWDTYGKRRKRKSFRKRR